MTVGSEVMFLCGIVSLYPYLSKTGTREIGGTDQSGSRRDGSETAGTAGRTVVKGEGGGGRVRGEGEG